MYIQTAADIFRLASEAHYRAKVREVLRPKGLSEQPQHEALPVSIIQGRWISRCPCGGAAACHPAWSYAACLACGRSWTRVVFPTPEELAEIDAVLSERPARVGHVIPTPFYSWEPGQTLADLRAENVRIAIARESRLVGR